MPKPSAFMYDFPAAPLLPEAPEPRETPVPSFESYERERESELDLEAELERQREREGEREGERAAATQASAGSGVGASEDTLPGVRIDPREVVLEDLVPLGLLIQAQHQEVCAQVFPSHGLLHVEYVQALMERFEVILTRLTAGWCDMNLLGHDMIDAAAFAWPPVRRMKLGVVARDQPISVVFQAFGSPCCPPFLNMMFYGRRPPPDVYNAYATPGLWSPHLGSVPLYPGHPLPPGCRTEPAHIPGRAPAQQDQTSMMLQLHREQKESAGQPMPTVAGSDAGAAVHRVASAASVGTMNVLDGGGVVSTFRRVQDADAASSLRWIVPPGEIPPSFATVDRLTALFGVPTEIRDRGSSVPVRAWIFASDRAVFSLELSPDARWGLRGEVLPGVIVGGSAGGRLLDGEGHDLLARIWLATR